MENPKTLQLDFGFQIKPAFKKLRKPTNQKSVQESFVFEFMDALTSPVIVFPSAWQDAIPKELLNNITLSRMRCLIKGEQMASLTEVIAYMMPRTFEAPMHPEWVNIYIWCGFQYTNMFNGSKQKKEMVTAMTEIAPKKLSDYEQRLLKDLRIWIYDKRRKALKQSLKAQKPSKLNRATVNQENLFDH